MANSISNYKTKHSYNIDEYLAYWQKEATRTLRMLTGNPIKKLPLSDNSYARTVQSIELASYEAMKSQPACKFIIFSGSHNLGKTTVRKHMHAYHQFVNFPHYTTRPPRAHEINGVDQYFVSEEELNEKAHKGEVFGLSKQCTSKCPDYYTAMNKQLFYELVKQNRPFTMERRLGSWRTILSDSDESMRNIAQKNALIVFIMPPSLDYYLTRIIRRAIDTTPGGSTHEINQKIAFEVDRSFSKHFLFGDARTFPNVLYIVGDNSHRVAKRASEFIEMSGAGQRTALSPELIGVPR